MPARVFDWRDDPSGTMVALPQVRARFIRREPNAPLGTMHGFLNVFLAAALLEHADAILQEEDPRAFAFDDDGASWRGHRVSTEEIIAMRRDFATSFGSCSFEEPIDDLKELGWL